MFVKPGKLPNGQPLRVRLFHDRRRHLSAAGEQVPDTQDWHRALLRGDVVAAEPPAPPAEKPPEPAAAPAEKGAA